MRERENLFWAHRKKYIFYPYHSINHFGRGEIEKFLFTHRWLWRLLYSKTLRWRRSKFSSVLHSCYHIGHSILHHTPTFRTLPDNSEICLPIAHCPINWCNIIIIFFPGRWVSQDEKRKLKYNWKRFWKISLTQATFLEGWK